MQIILRTIFQIFEEAKKKRELELAALPEDPITIKLPDGTEKKGVKGKTTPYDIALGISKGLAENSVVAKVNGKGWDMKRPLEGVMLEKLSFWQHYFNLIYQQSNSILTILVESGDCELELCKFDHPDGRETFWHSRQACLIMINSHECPTLIEQASHEPL